jgi:hypothetical protein
MAQTVQDLAQLVASLGVHVEPKWQLLLTTTFRYKNAVPATSSEERIVFTAYLFSNDTTESCITFQTHSALLMLHF